MCVDPLSSVITGDSIGGSDPHYQVFIELKGVRNLTEEQRYKVDETWQPALTENVCSFS